MKHLFAYGTLMSLDIFYSVTELKLPVTPGILKEYIRHPVIGQLYPGITPQNGAQVNGIIYKNVPAQAWTLLDLFEGEMYECCTVHIEDKHEKIITADTYIIRPEYRHCLGQNEWDFQHFLKTEKNTFQSSYAGYTAVKVTKQDR